MSFKPRVWRVGTKYLMLYTAYKIQGDTEKSKIQNMFVDISVGLLSDFFQGELRRSTQIEARLLLNLVW